MKKAIRINKYCTDDKNNPERMGCELSKESWRPRVRKSKNTECRGFMDFDRGIYRLSCNRRTKNLKCDFKTKLNLTPSGKRRLKSSGYKKKRLPYLNGYETKEESKSKKQKRKKQKSKSKSKRKLKKSKRNKKIKTKKISR